MSSRISDPRYLEGYWPLNGHAEDVSGRGRHGTWVGTEAYAAFLKGSRQAGDFAGSDDYVQLPLAAADFMNGQTAFSIACWIHPDTSPGSSIFDFRDADNDGVQLSYQANERVALRVNSVDSISVDFAVPNTWSYVVGVKRAAGDQEIYLNGELEDSDDSSAETVAVVTAPRIGINSLNLNGDFDGRIADLRVYSVALTISEVRQLFHEPVPTY